MRRLMIAGLLAATATVATAQAYQGSGYQGQGYQGQAYQSSSYDQGYDRYAPPPPGQSRPYRATNDPVERRWADAQARYSTETQRYRAEWDAYQRARGGAYGQAQPLPYDQGPDAYAGDDRDENGYDASRYYRSGSTYRERVLTADDRVYAGSDGRYYCKRNDGTTGLIAGGAAGGILGNVIDGGHSRAAGTLIGAAAGALLGRAVDQNSQQIRCR